MIDAAWFTTKLASQIVDIIHFSQFKYLTRIRRWRTLGRGQKWALKKSGKMISRRPQRTWIFFLPKLKSKQMAWLQRCLVLIFPQFSIEELQCLGLNRSSLTRDNFHWHYKGGRSKELNIETFQLEVATNFDLLRQNELHRLKLNRNPVLNLYPKWYIGTRFVDEQQVNNKF